MKTVGIIAEYNPFHNGHKYQLDYAKEALGADYIIAAMSGDFVQRGAPALLPKHVRAEAALRCGADLVLELPAAVSTASAELFARGGVQLLDGLGVADELCFGSEAGDIASLMEIGTVLAKEPPEYKAELKKGLRKGLSFPKARCSALAACLGSGEQTELLKGPNNILGIEYCKAILTEHSTMRPVTLQRLGNDYHQQDLSPSSLSSASAIRRLWQSGHTSGPAPCLADAFAEKAVETYLADALPGNAMETYRPYLRRPDYVDEEDFNLLFHYRLLSETPESLGRYLDIAPSLAQRIWRNRNDFQGFSQFCEQLKTKEITRTRIQRGLFHMLLGITDTPASMPYARVLGFRKKSTALLGEIKKKGSLPLITRPADAPALLDPIGLRLFEETAYASNVYQSVFSKKTGQPFLHEYSHPVVII